MAQGVSRGDTPRGACELLACGVRVWGEAGRSLRSAVCRRGGSETLLGADGSCGDPQGEVENCQYVKNLSAVVTICWGGEY